jgi:predicted phage gp36 major capsid-like protein
MEQAKQNITALINELDTAQDEVSKTSAADKLLIETFKVLVLACLSQEAIEEMAAFAQVMRDCHGKSKAAKRTALTEYRTRLRSCAEGALDLF